MPYLLNCKLCIICLQGGALRSDSWRKKVDHLLIEVATNAFRLGWTHDGKTSLPQEPKVTWDDFQLVALHALLASLLCPAGTRPPYLAQGLELFRKGNQSRNSSVTSYRDSLIFDVMRTLRF